VNFGVSDLFPSKQQIVGKTEWRAIEPLEVSHGSLLERLRWQVFSDISHNGKPADDPFIPKSTQENTSE